MKCSKYIGPFFFTLALLSAATLSAATFFPISSVQTNTVDFFVKENLIQGPGVGFDAAEPHNAIGATWVTDAPGGGNSNYYDFAIPPVITLDLGQDRDLTEISTWGYAATNANGVRDFSLRFATDADGPAGYGTSIAANPMFTMAIDPVPRQSFPFGDTITARYVELTAINNYAGLGQPGGDRVGLGEIAFEGTVPPPPPFTSGIIRPTILSSANANSFDVATPGKMVDNSGMTPQVNTGDSLSSALAATHVFGGFAESWVTNGVNPDYYGGGNEPPTFVFDLEQDTFLDAMVLWTYQNDGGGNPDGAGYRVGNQVREIELQFNTEAQGSDAFAGPTTTIFVAPRPTAPNDAQGFGIDATARYVLMRVVDNHFGNPDGFDVHPSIGGDRVGIGEVRFHGTAVPEPGTLALSAIGLAGLAFVARRRRGLTT